MDSLKSLIDKKNYDLVIKLTKGSEQADDLFYLVAAYTFKGEYENALFVIQDHQKIMEEKMDNLIKIHIELLCALERFEQARAILDYYANLPYQNQQVEETLRDMPRLIEAEEKKRYASRYFSDEQVLEKLENKEFQDVIFGIELVKTRDIFMYLDAIKLILLSNKSRTIRSLALMLLVQKEVDREIQFNDGEQIIVVNPKKLKDPFSGSAFNEFTRKLENCLNNTSEAEIATHLFLNYVIYTYPHELDDKNEELLAALVVLAHQYMGEDYPLEKHLEGKSLSKDKVESYITLIHEIEADA